MAKDPYIILPPDPDWPAQYRLIAARLRAELGDIALRIDHTGSTAVPGLCSKNVIDIQITVANLHDPALLEILSAAGFQIRAHVQHDHIPPGHAAPQSEWEKRFFREPPGARTAHIHIRPEGKPNQRYALLFRDYLRAHPAAAGAYGLVKERLAPKLDRLDYIEAKDPVCDLIIQAAEAWAEKVGWQPGPSDA